MFSWLEMCGRYWGGVSARYCLAANTLCDSSTDDICSNRRIQWLIRGCVSAGVHLNVPCNLESFCNYRLPEQRPQAWEPYEGDSSGKTELRCFVCIMRKSIGDQGSNFPIKEHLRSTMAGISRSRELRNVQFLCPLKSRIASVTIAYLTGTSFPLVWFPSTSQERKFSSTSTG